MSGNCPSLYQNNSIVPNLIDTISQGIMILDLDGNVRYINNWLCRLLGYEKEELVGINHHAIARKLVNASKEKFARIDQVFKEIVSSGHGISTKQMFYDRNGAPVPVIHSISRIDDSGGEPAGVMHVIEDAQKYVLNELTGELHNYLNLKELLSKTVNLCVEYLGLSSAAIFLHEPNDDTLLLKSCNVCTDEELDKIRVKIGEGIPGKIAKERSVYYVENLHTDPEIDPLARQIHPDKSSIGYPMVAHGNLVGVIAFDAPTVRPFSEREKELFKAISERVAIAIHNAQMFEHLERLSNTDDLTGLYNHRYFHQKIHEEVQSALEKNIPLSLMMVDIDQFKIYNDTFGHQVGDELLKELSVLMKQIAGPKAFVARYGGEEFSILLTNTSTAGAIRIAEKLRKAVAEQAFFGVNGQPNGYLTISIGLASVPEDTTDKNELINYADQALYLAKHRGRNRVEVYYSVLDELLRVAASEEQEELKAIKTLMMVINAKDLYTFGHSERVTEYSLNIAQAMGLDTRKTRILRYGAYLHDIGKIEISREILTKQGKLMPDEYDTIKKHPGYGWEILKSIKIIKDCLPVVLYHHERYDGTGYPHGLKGEEIPLLARIVAVADSYDAMTSQRPYQRCRSVEEAILELKRCSGSQFDPAVVKAFIDILGQRDIDNALACSH